MPHKKAGRKKGKGAKRADHKHISGETNGPERICLGTVLSTPLPVTNALRWQGYAADYQYHLVDNPPTSDGLLSVRGFVVSGGEVVQRFITALVASWFSCGLEKNNHATAPAYERTRQPVLLLRARVGRSVVNFRMTFPHKSAMKRRSNISSRLTEGLASDNLVLGLCSLVTTELAT